MASQWQTAPLKAWSSGMAALRRRVKRLAGSAMRQADATREFSKISDAGYALLEKSLMYLGDDERRSEEWSELRAAALAARDSAVSRQRDASEERLRSARAEARAADRAVPSYEREVKRMIRGRLVK